METKYAVALLKGDFEKILALFDTKAEADDFGKNNPIPHDEGLHYCFMATFKEGVMQGNSISVYGYYNAPKKLIYA